MRLNHIDYSCPTQDKIEKDCARLGIDVDIDWMHIDDRPSRTMNVMMVCFNSQEDMHLYKMLGTVKETYYILFEFKQ